MEMPFEEFEVAPARTLSGAQERRLNRKYTSGDFGGGSFSTIKSLIALGYVEEDGSLTEKSTHYCYHHGAEMPI